MLAPCVSTSQLAAEITGSTATIAELTDGAGLRTAVPTCPEWTLRELITHVGRAHRWATAIVSGRLAAPLGFREVPDGKLPGEPGEHPGWLRAGASRLIAAAGEAGTEEMWTLAGPGQASFWVRRMAHETAVHRADCQLAFGQRPAIRPQIAADGISEWLGLICQPGGRADQLSQRWLGHTLHLHATDDGLGVPGEWTVRGEPGGVTVTQGHDKGEAALRGPAGALLLVLTRRFRPDDPAVEVLGDPGVLATWLAATPF
jgi:uncharacterized protein (TIGR03083 family)